MATQCDSVGRTDGTGSETTVLFVDDEPDLLETYESLFAPEHAVVTAAGGEEALARFDGDIDIAFFDRRMPDLAGEEVIRRLRDRGSQIPMIIVSGVESTDALTAEYDAYLTKPVGIDTIRATMADMLE